MKPVEQIPLSQIRQAQRNPSGISCRTPLIPLRDEDSDRSIYLKLEVLQPIGSFKLRGAGNRLALVDQVDHVLTASAGNMAQGVAWVARQRGIPCTVVMPDHAPQTKLDAVRRLGGKPIQVPFAEWWDTLVNRRFPGLDGLFVHPVSDPEVIAGNATIGLEILEDLPDVDTVIVPFGGGGLSCGIACAMEALKPSVDVFACEVDTACPFSVSLAAGKAMKIDYQASFVDGIGAGGVLEEMWPLASRILAGSRVVSIEETAAALKLLLERNRVLAEGAGAAALAAALKGGSDDGKTVCVISGGNIDSAKVISDPGGKSSGVGLVLAFLETLNVIPCRHFGLPWSHLQVANSGAKCRINSAWCSPINETGRWTREFFGIGGPLGPGFAGRSRLLQHKAWNRAARQDASSLRNPPRPNLTESPR